MQNGHSKSLNSMIVTGAFSSPLTVSSSMLTSVESESVLVVVVVVSVSMSSSVNACGNNSLPSIDM